MKLQDYLHYYLGCSFWTDNSEGQVNLTTIPFIRAMIEKGKNVQLQLRRLEDMNRDDMKPIWGLIFNRPFPDSGRILWFDKEERTAAKRYVMMPGVDRLGIEMTGYIWADIDLGHVKFNPNLAFHYLLTQHFDLFGLIEAAHAAVYEFADYHNNQNKNQ
jgi:hypothetical protein